MSQHQKQRQLQAKAAQTLAKLHEEFSAPGSVPSGTSSLLNPQKSLHNPGDIISHGREAAFALKLGVDLEEEKHRTLQDVKKELKAIGRLRRASTCAAGSEDNDAAGGAGQGCTATSSTAEAPDTSSPVQAQRNRRSSLPVGLYTAQLPILSPLTQQGHEEQQQRNQHECEQAIQDNSATPSPDPRKPAPTPAPVARRRASVIGLTDAQATQISSSPPRSTTSALDIRAGSQTNRRRASCIMLDTYPGMDTAGIGMDGMVDDLSSDLMPMPGAEAALRLLRSVDSRRAQSCEPELITTRARRSSSVGFALGQASGSPPLSPVGLKESSSAGLKASLDALKSKSAANLTAAPSPGPSSAPHSPQAVTPQLSLPSLVPRADSASGAASLATRDRSVRLALAPSIGSLSDASSEADSDAGCGSPTCRSPSQAEEDDAKRARFRRRASRLSAVVYNDASGPLDLSGPLSQLLQPPDDNNDSNTDELYMLLNSADALNSNLNSKSGRVKGVGVRREKCEFEQRARSHSTLGFVTAAELSGAGLGGRAQRVSSSTALPPLQHPVLAARASQSSAQGEEGLMLPDSADSCLLSDTLTKASPSKGPCKTLLTPLYAPRHPQPLTGQSSATARTSGPGPCPDPTAPPPAATSDADTAARALPRRSVSSGAGLLPSAPSPTKGMASALFARASKYQRSRTVAPTPDVLFARGDEGQGHT